MSAGHYYRWFFWAVMATAMASLIWWSLWALLFCSPLLLALFVCFGPSADAAAAQSGISEHRRSVVVLLSAAFIAAVALPQGPETMDSTYTDSLFTARPGSIRFVDDALFQEKEFRTWERWRFGYPFQAVTLDVGKEGQGFMAMFEWPFTIFNALAVVSGTLLGLLVLLCAKKGVSPTRHPRGL